MFLCDADLIQLPQAVDLSQKYVQVEITHRLAAFGRVEHELACSPAVAAQQRIHVLARQCRQAMVGSWGMRPNQLIERTTSGALRAPTVAAHRQR